MLIGCVGQAIYFQLLTAVTFRVTSRLGQDITAIIPNPVALTAESTVSPRLVLFARVGGLAGN